MRILTQFIPLQFKEIIRGYINHLPICLFRANFDRKLKRHVPIFVYQMGKVGSRSIYRSLLKQYPGVVLHAHTFSKDYKGWKIRRLYHFVVSEKMPVNVIALIREPIGRNISAFFENFERDTGVPYRKSQFSIKELETIFLSNYRHNVPLEWFDKHILKHFGIDVYATPYPESASATYSRANVRLLVMQLEISDKEKTEAIEDFTGLTGLRLFNENLAEDKDYAETYRDFKVKAKLPLDYVSTMCESRYFNHFFSKAVMISDNRATYFFL